MGPVLQVISFACLLLVPACAYPELYVEGGFSNSCTDHPSKGYGNHGAPVADKTTTFTLRPAGAAAAAAAAPVTSLCPGQAYEVSVGYGSSRRRTLLTASGGTLGSATDKACPNRATSNAGSATTFTDSLTLPCQGVTGPIQLKVTSAAGSSDDFHSAATTLPLAPLAQCPASSCPGAPTAAAAAAGTAAAAAAAAAKNATAANATAANATAAAAAPVAAAAAPVRSAARVAGQGGCDPSPYGYACVVDAGAGAMLHFTRGGPDPPDNDCTAAAVWAVGSDAGSDPGNEPIHFMLESPVVGYSGLSFPASKGVMAPADAVIGWLDEATGQPQVSAYHLTDYDPLPSPTNQNGRGWATNMGVARPTNNASAAAGPSSLLCFTRMVTAPDALVVKDLDLKALNLNWAGDDTTRFVAHVYTGSLTLNVADGSAAPGSAVASAGNGRLAATLAHGALMLLSFVVFLPLGGLLARHKWLFGNKEKGGISPGWFQGHRLVNSAGLATALAGFIVALVVFNVSWSLSDPEPHPLYDLHRFLGLVVMIFVVLQAGAGFVRPGLGTRYRTVWRFGHLSLGWLTMALGIVVVFVGVVLMHDMVRQPWINWLLPVVLLLGLLLLAGIALELKKIKIESSGRYRPAAHKFGDPSLHPKRSLTPTKEAAGSGAATLAVDGLQPGHQV